MYSAMVLAAGIGSRMGLGYNKMLYEIKGAPVIIHTIKKFLDDEICGQIVLVVNELEVQKMQQLLDVAKLMDERIEIVKGGTERQYSVYNGLQAINQEIVLVHDGARPFVTSEMIEKCYELANSGYPSIVAVPVKDTMKRVINGVVIEHQIEMKCIVFKPHKHHQPLYLDKHMKQQRKKISSGQMKLA